MKLNLGCGPDHKEDFLGIDISPECNPDLVFDFEKESLLAHFEEGSIEGILAFDIIEHMLHIYAVKVLRECFLLLQPQGKLSIRVPDFEVIINKPGFSTEDKIFFLYGGQEGWRKGFENNELRRENPENYCHKFAYTKETIKQELCGAGFAANTLMEPYNEGTNLIVVAEK